MERINRVLLPENVFHSIFLPFENNTPLFFPSEKVFETDFFPENFHGKWWKNLSIFHGNHPIPWKMTETRMENHVKIACLVSEWAVTESMAIFSHGKLDFPSGKISLKNGIFHGFLFQDFFWKSTVRIEDKVRVSIRVSIAWYWGVRYANLSAE
jgi:hypothetical protein